MAQQDNTWESAWRSALDHKAMTPPDEVWENIEAELENKGRSKRMLPIWWVAAGITIISATGIWINEYYNSKNELLSQQKSSTTIAENNALHPVDDKSTSILSQKDQNTAGKIFEKSSGFSEKKDNAAGNALNKSAEKNALALAGNSVSEVNKPDDRSGSTAIPVVYDFLPELLDKIKAVEFEFMLPEVPEIWGVAMPYAAKRKTSTTAWYAGVDLSAGASSLSSGGMDADFSASPQAEFSNNIYNDVSSSSQSTSLGLTVGKKLSKRIIIETGLSYLQIQNIGSSNLVLSSGSEREAFNSNADLSGAVLTTTTPYELQHVHQFISIPVKAGYLIIDNKWKMSLNSGLSGDYFFKTYTEDLSGNLGTYETTPGSDDQWNEVTVSFLGEINLARQLGKHYYIALSPQIRKAMSDLSNTTTELKPLVIQVGVQLKYEF